MQGVRTDHGHSGPCEPVGCIMYAIFRKGGARIEKRRLRPTAHSSYRTSSSPPSLPPSLLSSSPASSPLKKTYKKARRRQRHETTKSSWTSPLVPEVVVRTHALACAKRNLASSLACSCVCLLYFFSTLTWKLTTIAANHRLEPTRRCRCVRAGFDGAGL